MSLDAPVGGETEDITIGDMIADPDNPLEGVEDDLYRKQLRGVVGDALDKLPEDQQAALRLRYFDGLTYKEAGEISGTTPENIRQREHKGIRRLRRGDMIGPLREAWYGSRSLYRGTGLSAWKQTGSSAQERAVIRQEEVERRKGAMSREKAIQWHMDTFGCERWYAEMLYPERE